MNNNIEAARRMRRHYAQMIQECGRLVPGLWNAGETWYRQRDELIRYLDHELLPHAAAEEATLYRQGQRLPALAALRGDAI